MVDTNLGWHKNSDGSWECEAYGDVYDIVLDFDGEWLVLQNGSEIGKRRLLPKAKQLVQDTVFPPTA